MSEPHWAMALDAWGNPKGRYSFKPRRGWSCHHCGGMFRGLPALLEHQDRMLNESTPITSTMFQESNDER